MDEHTKSSNTVVKACKSDAILRLSVWSKSIVNVLAKVALDPLDINLAKDWRHWVSGVLKQDDLTPAVE